MLKQDRDSKFKQVIASKLKTQSRFIVNQGENTDLECVPRLETS